MSQRRDRDEPPSKVLKIIDYARRSCCGRDSTRRFDSAQLQLSALVIVFLTAAMLLRCFFVDGLVAQIARAEFFSKIRRSCSYNEAEDMNDTRRLPSPTQSCERV